MTTLRHRMTEDMRLAGFTPGTQRNYLIQIKWLAKHYMIAPEELTERQVRDYFIYLREEKKVARGSFQIARSAIRFLYYVTLDSDWSLFSKKRSPCRSRSVCPTRDRTTRSVSCSELFAAPSTEPAYVPCTPVGCGSARRPGCLFRQSIRDRCCCGSSENGTKSVLSR